MRPHAGAEYVITKDAYGRVWGFLNGWSQFLISRTASAAALAVGFAIFMNDLMRGKLEVVYFTRSRCLSSDIEIPFGHIQVVALITLAVTTLINCAAVGVTGHIASFVTILKVIVVLGVGVAAFFYQDGSWGHCRWQTRRRLRRLAVTSGGFAGFAAAMLGALWAYDGWNNVSYMAGEVKNPGAQPATRLDRQHAHHHRALRNRKRQLLLRDDPTEVASVSATSSVAAESIRTSAWTSGGDLDGGSHDAVILGFAADLHPRNGANSLRDGPRRRFLSEPGARFEKHPGAGHCADGPGSLGGGADAFRLV